LNVSSSYVELEGADNNQFHNKEDDGLKTKNIKEAWVKATAVSDKLKYLNT